MDCYWLRIENYAGMRLVSPNIIPRGKIHPHLHYVDAYLLLYRVHILFRIIKVATTVCMKAYNNRRGDIYRSYAVWEQVDH